MTTKTVNVPGISCEHCVMTIEREIAGMKGVSEVKADRVSKDVTVSWDPAGTDWESIRGLLVEINFPPAE